MPLDANILLQGQQQVPLQNPLDSMAKMLTMKHLANQNQAQDREFSDQQAMRDAYKNNMTVGADGTPTVNREGFMSQLGQSNPMLAMQKGQEFRAQDLAAQEQKMKTLSDQISTRKQLLSQVPMDNSATPEQKQQAWTQMLTQSDSLGLPPTGALTAQYPGDQQAKGLLNHLMTGEAQLAQQNKDREFNQKGIELGLKHQEIAVKRDQLMSDKDNKDAQALDKHLALGWTARSGQAGVVQGKMTNAEAAETLLEQIKGQPGGASASQLEELAGSTAKLINGNNSTASERVNALVPHTGWGKVQSVHEWAVNHPVGTDQQAFTDRLGETVAREKALAQNQMKQFQIEGLPAFAALKSRNPNLYNNILSAKGIDPSMIDSKGRYKAAPHASGNDLNDLSDKDLDKMFKDAGGK